MPRSFTTASQYHAGSSTERRCSSASEATPCARMSFVIRARSRSFLRASSSWLWMISLLDHFVKRLDRAARARRRSRSELIREALRAYLGDREGGPADWTSALAPLRAL